VHTCAYACVCICVYTYACIGACVYVCICIYVCLYICMHIHLYTRACGCTYALVQAHFVYLNCPISLLHARVSQVFLNTCMHVCGGIGSGVCFSLFRLVLVTHVGGYVLAGVEIGGLSCIFFYFGGC